ncbi:type III pantothenate kinase [Streptomonospora sp. S1-112]|uniref:Type III pantothenate kinase n=2 Tax=Streptomonospora TaxID=104204 RepID=A0A853BPH9_9ACTN|nr:MULTISPECIES: type III pantothenate kinase [Streptomonospora]MBV2361760.1 type III pantothenate kinase [Streptomonospora nanhaiensis]MBX9391258.1 type III pantothenate kinase [Streptomonospora nanhaiensis]MDA0563549.1 type III pantothenate kinase [Streptomonospora mangrovi]NYI96421.1 type III pantothenate kinase [Streptomonospora nanhaiensis]
MLLAIDVGNSHTVLGLFDDEDLLEHWRVSTEARRTADEWAVVLQGLIGGSSMIGAGAVDGISLCCSVPSVQHEMREMFRRHFGDVPAVIVEPGVKTGVPVRMDNPKEVGSDRIVNALAAVQLYGGPAVVVDFGTATTFDAVSAKGEYVGGAIAPGIDISVEALSRRGAQLHMVELVKPRTVIAKNTTEALRSGIVFGFAGQVDGIVDRMAQELTDDADEVTVVATGGLAPMVVDECETVDVHEPWLTLIGLRLVFQRNT